MTEKQRDRADNKNPKQSWVAQLVFNIITLLSNQKVNIFKIYWIVKSVLDCYTTKNNVLS